MSLTYQHLAKIRKLIDLLDFGGVPNSVEKLIAHFV